MTKLRGMRRGARRGLSPLLFAAALVAATLSVAPAARAYTIASLVSDGCHEKIMTAALRAVRLELATAAPVAADRNDRALIDDVEFTPANDMTDLGGATLLLGVRDNDLKGREATDLGQLALIHGDPAAQREHCLRGPNDKEPGGSETAILDCRAFIRERIAEALAGLDASGAPDPANRTSLPVYLALRHEVDAALPTYYVRAGQALHAAVDSFSHTYRSPDDTQITVVLNWLDHANERLVESRDGPAHLDELDRCDDPDPLRQRRRELATEAATEILRTTLDPAQSNDQKLGAVDLILDRYLSYTPGCTFDNDWCNAPEREYGSGGGGCGIAGSARGRDLFGGAVVLAAAVLLRRGRRRRSWPAIGALVASLLMGLAAGEARGAPDAKEPAGMALGAHLAGAGSFDHGALAATLGARLRVDRHWTFGLDAEWNPWIAVEAAQAVRAGVFNAYATVILRVPLSYERFNLRTTANLGMSRLLIDLYGAPKGSTGIYAGLSPLGIEWEISRRAFLLLDPIGIAVPIPHLSGVPFSYTQYRATLGVEIYFD